MDEAEKKQAEQRAALQDKLKELMAIYARLSELEKDVFKFWKSIDELLNHESEGETDKTEG